MKRKNKDSIKAAKPMPIVVLRAFTTAFLITAAAFVIFACLITYTSVTEANMPAAVMVTTIISVVTAGIMTARNADKNGWIYGMGVGVLYAFAIILTGFIFSPEIKFTLKTLSTIILSAAGGGIGGMIGINLKIK